MVENITRLKTPGYNYNRREIGHQKPPGVDMTEVNRDEGVVKRDVIEELPVVNEGIPHDENEGKCQNTLSHGHHKLDPSLEGGKQHFDFVCYCHHKLNP